MWRAAGMVHILNGEKEVHLITDSYFNNCLKKNLL